MVVFATLFILIIEKLKGKFSAQIVNQSRTAIN